MRTAEEVRAWVAAGETSSVEFKRFPGLTDEFKADLAREACALANGRGGVVLLGVEDDGTMSGLPDGAFAEVIVSAVRDRVRPAMIPHYEEVSIDGRRVGILEIDEGFAKPYAVTVKGAQRYQLRVGTTVREASREELVRLAQASGALHFDRTPVEEASPAELDDSAIGACFEDDLGVPWWDQAADSRLRLLVNKGLVRVHRGQPLCTVGGLLLFGRQPDRLLPQAGAAYARFEGVDLASRMLEQERIGSNLPACLERLRLLLDRSSPPRVAEDAAGRRSERAAYPWHDAVHEAVVNALVHRDYTLSGARVRMLLFLDRLEVRSPGALPNGMTPEQARLGATAHRNTLLMEVMHQRGHVEAIGRGVVRMIRAMKAAGAREPELCEEAGEVVVRLHPAPTE